MIVDESDCALLIVDVQSKLLDKINNKNEIIANINKAKSAFNILNLPILISEQYPKGLGKTEKSILNDVNNYSKIEKTSFSCFRSEDFCKKLKVSNKSQIIICGIETHICIFQTAYDLSNGNYNIFVLSDCVSSINYNNHIEGLNRLRQANIKIINTEMLIFDILKDSKHKNFKELSSLIK